MFDIGQEYLEIVMFLLHNLFLDLESLFIFLPSLQNQTIWRLFVWRSCDLKKGLN